MKDVRFYLEFETPRAKRAGKHTGNVFAAFVGNGVTRGVGGGYEGLGAVHDYPNSPVATTAASWNHLRLTKRVSEKTAREIHPLLFERLDG